MGVFSRATPAAPAPARLNLAGGMQRAQAVPYGARRTLQASAQRLTPKDLAATAQNKAQYLERQQRAWGHYDAIGEVHFGFGLVANILSRVRLYAGNVTDPSEAPAPLDAKDTSQDVPEDLVRVAEQAIAELVSGNFAGFLRSFALNFHVPGECLLVRLDGGWTIRSTTEIDVRTDGAYEVPQQGQMGRKLPKDTPIARIWQAHPKHSRDPDSSLMSVADSCDELLLVSRLIRSVVRSRLNAGLLFVPDGLVVAGRTEQVTMDEDGNPIPGAVVDPGNAFLADLMDAMLTPVSDEASASNVVPMVVTGPGDLADKIKYITFSRGSDEWLVNRADRALERVLQGIDVPKDIVTGLASVKYSNAIVIDEGLYKAHIEPLALALCDALTEVYLRPYVLSQGADQEQADRIGVWYDPSEIVTRPNQAQDATDGYDKGLLSSDAWRRAHGFGDTDVPTEEDLALLMLVTKAQIPDDVSTALVNQAMPNLMAAQREENIASSPVPFPETAKKLLSVPGTGPGPGAGGSPGGPPPGGTPAPVPETGPAA